tara:strand:+ start:596 stop:823 length:228 start_codon:yes stop_codon:yes gene_type:complete
MSSFRNSFQKLRNKYINPNIQEKSLEENNLQIQIEIAQKIKQLNENFFLEIESNNYNRCLMLTQELEVLLSKLPS